MGNDSGIRKKSKQRTVPHKKHSVFPGMILTPEVFIDKGSIRNKEKPVLPNFPTGKGKPISDSMWEGYDKASFDLRNEIINKSSAPLAGRNGAEDRFVVSYQKLVKAGLAQRIKRKYWTR